MLLAGQLLLHGRCPHEPPELVSQARSERGSAQGRFLRQARPLLLPTRSRAIDDRVNEANGHVVRIDTCPVVRTKKIIVMCENIISWIRLETDNERFESDNAFFSTLRTDSAAMLGVSVVHGLQEIRSDLRSENMSPTVSDDTGMMISPDHRRSVGYGSNGGCLRTFPGGCESLSLFYRRVLEQQPWHFTPQDLKIPPV